MNKRTLFCQRADCELIVEAHTGKIKMCSQMQGVELFSNDIENLKQNLQKGKRIQECEFCWNCERRNLVSHRQTGNDFWRQNQGNCHLDLFLYNDCNAACIYCNQNYSTQWQNEIKNTKYSTPEIYRQNKSISVTDKHKEKLLDYVKQLALDVNKTACIAVNGGEPSLYAFRDNFLENIIETFFKYTKSDRNMRLDFFTNCNSSPTQTVKLINLFDYYKTIYPNFQPVIQPSFESVGKTFEYVRYGIKWEDFTDNLFRWADSNFEKNITATINSVSLNNLYEFLKFVNEYASVSKNIVNLRLNELYKPDQFSLRYLDDTFLDYFNKCIKYLKTEKIYINNNKQVIKNLKNLKSKINTQKPTQEFLKEFFEINDYFKNERSLDINNINPYLYDYFLNMSEKCG